LRKKGPIWLKALQRKFGYGKCIVSQILNPLQETCDFKGPMASIKLFVKNPNLLKQLVDRTADATIEETKALANARDVRASGLDFNAHTL